MYQLWVEFDNCDPSLLFASYCPIEVREYGLNRVVHGNNVKQIAIHDTTGRLDVLYKRNWNTEMPELSSP